VPEGLAINDSTPVADEDDRPGRFARPDGLFDDFGNGNKPLFPDFSRQGREALGGGGQGGARAPKKGKQEQKEKRIFRFQPMSSLSDPHGQSGLGD
jgi:hypothetical protein